MKYEWEDTARVNEGVEVIGTVYWNRETGEGALVLAPIHEELTGVERADVLVDVLGDVSDAYDAALRNMFGEVEAVADAISFVEDILNAGKPR